MEEAKILNKLENFIYDERISSLFTDENLNRLLRENLWKMHRSIQLRGLAHKPALKKIKIFANKIFETRRRYIFPVFEDSILLFIETLIDGLWVYYDDK